jgi:magnesium chelatase subunit D
MDAAKTGLLLLAIDRSLQGVLIAGGPGTAKSVLARSFRSVSLSSAFIEIPIGATADHLYGCLDLERTLLTGKRQFDSGLLARARGGFLFVDHINLLERTAAHRLAAALASDTALIATYDPADGEVGSQLLDSVGIHVCTGELSRDERLGLLNRISAFDNDPRGFADRYVNEISSLRAHVDAARTRLPAVTITAEDRRRLSMSALSLGIVSHRADIFAGRLARAHAAHRGRTYVEEEDLKAAIALVLSPRASTHSTASDSVMSRPQSRNASRPFSEHEEAPREAPDDLLIQARDCRLTEDLMDAAQTKGAGEARRRGVNDAGATNWRRGRYVRAAPSRHDRSARIAVEATLRAAAPFQLERRQSQDSRIRVTADDLRYKQFKQKAGMLIIFAVDASGSMALNRIHLAKGALIRLLQQAYVHRDKVALIGFRSDRAEVLLPPTRSVELARRAVDSLAVGGGTPLASGIEAALQLARRTRNTGLRQAMLVLFTDGSANVSRGGSRREAVWAELAEVCSAFRLDGFSSVVVDTRHYVLSGGEAERLARMLGGKYVFLQRPDSDTIGKAVSAIADTKRQ